MKTRTRKTLLHDHSSDLQTTASLQSLYTLKYSGSDYPAELVFRTRYDAEIEGLTTLTGLLGVASGTVNSIPPGEAGLTVEKFLSFNDGPVEYSFQGGQCAYSAAAACDTHTSANPGL